jgi:hypothetical protein
VFEWIHLSLYSSSLLVFRPGYSPTDDRRLSTDSVEYHVEKGPERLEEDDGRLLSDGLGTREAWPRRGRRARAQ